jgi:hypothetical protein
LDETASFDSTDETKIACLACHDPTGDQLKWPTVAGHTLYSPRIQSSRIVRYADALILEEPDGNLIHLPPICLLPLTLELVSVLIISERGCIFHIDRGSQYCSHDYQKILREHGLMASMSGKGNCYDNAAVETFFKTIKAELIWRHTWETRRKAETAIFQ